MWRVPIMTALVLAPAIAHASNAAVPRTPPVFKLQACLSVVDRSVDPVFHLDFAIPYEDTMLTEDEPAEARRFQFFALCRDHDAQETLPSWIALADAEAALAAGAIDALPESGDVLADHPAWPSACVQPMNAADDRIPITCDATAGGLDFDTTGMPAGNSIVYGYTYAPALNLWTPRAGLLRVTDGDDAAIDPVVSLMSPLHEATAYMGSGYRIVGCMAGVPGTIVELAWARVADDLADPSVWQPLGDPIDTPDFDVLFTPPAETVNQALVVRAIATDPRGRTWTAHARGLVVVLSGDAPSDGPELPPGPDFCGAYPELPDDGTDGTAGEDGDSDGTEGGVSSTTSDGSSSDATGGEPSQDDRGGGCGCRARAGGSDAAAAFLLVAMAAARRRTGPGQRRTSRVTLARA